VIAYRERRSRTLYTRGRYAQVIVADGTDPKR